MRQVVLDTETTGLNPKLGDRIIEIGCVELLNRRLSERSFTPISTRSARWSLGRRACTASRARTSWRSRSSPRWRRRSSTTCAAPSSSSTTRTSTSSSSTELALAGCAARAACRAHHRHAGFRQGAAPRQEELARRAVRALLRRQLQALAARRARRRLLARRVLSRDDARAGEPDDGARRAVGGAGAAGMILDVAKLIVQRAPRRSSPRTSSISTPWRRTRRPESLAPPGELVRRRARQPFRAGQGRHMLGSVTS